MSPSLIEQRTSMAEGKKLYQGLTTEKYLWERSIDDFVIFILSIDSKKNIEYHQYLIKPHLWGTLQPKCDVLSYEVVSCITFKVNQWILCDPGLVRRVCTLCSLYIIRAQNVWSRDFNYNLKKTVRIYWAQCVFISTHAITGLWWS